MYQNSKPGPVRSTADLKPLPRGRHKLDSAALKAERRERLVEAMRDLLAERGYAATTVPDVVARARVSRNAFYEFFQDKEDCYLALCVAYGKSLHRIAIGHMASNDWRTVLRQGLHDYLLWWQERADFARTYFVEAPLVSGAALAEREKTYLPFEAMFSNLAALIRQQNPKTPPLPARVPRMLVLAVMGILAEEVRAGRENQLVQMEDDLFFMTVNLLAGKGGA